MEQNQLVTGYIKNCGRINSEFTTILTIFIRFQLKINKPILFLFDAMSEVLILKTFIGYLNKNSNSTCKKISSISTQ